MVVLCSTSLLAGCQSFKPISAAGQQTVASARQWTRGGVAALRNVRAKQARTLFSRPSAQDPNEKTVHANLARAAQQQNQSQPAIEHMQRAVELAGNEPKLIVELGEMYLAAGQWLPAKRQSELALNINHRFAPGWALQAKTSLAKGNLDAALADFQRAAGLDPGLPGVQLAIADIYRRKQQPLRALAAVEQLLNQYPPDQQPERVLLAKSVALMELRQLGPAIEVLQTASHREDASSEVFLRLGQAQLLAGQVSQARLTLNLGKKSFPERGEFDLLLSELQSAQQRLASVDATAIR
jgi:tetratricopeptide (TPR) repeat protein